jgi:hypothetical protein
MNKKDRNVTDIPKLARQWLNSGRFFKWTSASEENKSFGELNIFSVQKGDGKKPPILMIHGLPRVALILWSFLICLAWITLFVRWILRGTDFPTNPEMDTNTLLKTMHDL